MIQAFTGTDQRGLINNLPQAPNVFSGCGCHFHFDRMDLFLQLLVYHLETIKQISHGALGLLSQAESLRLAYQK